MNIAVIQLQRGEHEVAKLLLEKIEPDKLEQRAYLYYGTWFEYYSQTNETEQALGSINAALALVTNTAERNYLFKKKALI